MILASHQPNFAPYMGYFYKMYMCDVFTFSDAVEFSRSGFHNYNFIWENRDRSKITIPVKSHSGLIKDVQIADPEKTFNKLLRRIKIVYGGQKYFDDVYEMLERVYGCYGSETYLSDKNKMLIIQLCWRFGISPIIQSESFLSPLTGAPTEQIIQLCQKLNCDRYLSGTGAREYLDENLMKQNGIDVIWSKYKTLEYGSLPDLSVIDYVMKRGFTIPDEWKKQKEELNEGRVVFI